MTFLVGEVGTFPDISTFRPISLPSPQLEWQSAAEELGSWSNIPLGEHSVTIHFDGSQFDGTLQRLLVGYDLSRLPSYDFNLHGEMVCDFTGIVDYCCAHCQGLPWEPEGGVQWD